jgi:hypothetical protein
LDDKTRQLIINAQAGNAESFHQLVALHDDRIMALAFQLLKKSKRRRRHLPRCICEGMEKYQIF